MAQPILIGLITAIGMLAAAIVTLIGVLLRTFADFKLGKRSAGVAEQTADDNRAKELAAENKALREEMKLLRKEDRVAEETLEQKIADLKKTLAERDDAVSGLTAQLNVALRAQERAEGGLVNAERTLHTIRLPLEHDAPALLLPPNLSLPPPEHRQEQP